MNVLLVLLLLASATAAFAQENTSNDATYPLVFSVENTGASFAAPAFPDFAHAPIIRPLPDPFVFFTDGHRDTSFGAWEQRRNEIKAAMENYEIGPKPDCSDCTVNATWTPATAPTRGTLTITVTRPVNGNNVTVTIPTRCYIPTGTAPADGYPAIIPMVSSAGSSNLGTGSLPAAAFTGKALASCDFPHNSVTTYGGPKLTDNFYKLYPNLCAGTTNCTAANGFPNGSNSGQYAAWSWGVSRVIDGIIIATHQATNPLPVDVSHLMVTGCSYAGKMALYAGAFDERIALTVAQENGGGGAPSWRVSQQIESDDKVENLDHTDHNWYASYMWQYQGNNVNKLPHDHHELMAMVAPRALLETGNTNYLWLSNQSNTISARATEKIYATFGIEDRFGYYIDGGHAHCGTLAAEAPVVGAWVDKFLRGITTANTDTRVTPFPTIDDARWSAWWGTNNPVFPNNWDPGNLNSTIGGSMGSVVLSMPTALGLNFGDTLSAGYDLMKPDGHPAATVTLNGDAYLDASVEGDVSCPDGTSYTLTVPFSKQSYSIGLNDNFWYPSADPASPLGYQGALANSAANACNGGVVTNCVFSAKGTQTTRGAGNGGGPGFTDTDTADPLNVRFHISNNGVGGAWSQPSTVFYTPNAWGKVQIVGTAQLTKQADGSYQAVITLKDSGTGTAQYVKLLSATLGSTATGSPLPVSVGAIQPSGTGNATVSFPSNAGNSGSGSVLKISGTYNGGSYATSFRVVLP
jgi:Glucuronyl esterase, fungi